MTFLRLSPGVFVSADKVISLHGEPGAFANTVNLTLITINGAREFAIVDQSELEKFLKDINVVDLVQKQTFIAPGETNVE